MSFHYVVRCRACDVVLRECRCPSDDKLISYSVCTKCQQKLTSTVKLIDAIDACIRLASGKYKVVEGNLEATNFVNLKRGGEEFLLWLGPNVPQQLDVPDSIIDRLRLLTDDQRRVIFAEFCASCGSLDSGCQCWNDE